MPPHCQIAIHKLNEANYCSSEICVNIVLTLSLQSHDRKACDTVQLACGEKETTLSLAQTGD